MEKETELYLIKRIRELESENAYLKAKENGKPFNREVFKETCTKDDLSKALDNHFIVEFHGYDVNKLLDKAKAFDKLQDILNVSIASFPDEKRYILYSPKHSKDKPSMFKQIDIDEETHDIIWRALAK